MLDFHKHANDAGEVLILRRIPQNRITHSGFVWPSGVGSFVECSDWEPTQKCGNGLHGWPWGFGLGDGCDYDIIGDIWLVVGCKPEDVIGELEGGAKCKFRCGVIRLEGTFGDAMNAVSEGFGEYMESINEDHTSDLSTSAANGYGSKSAANGYGSKSAANGDGSKSAANGYGSTSAANGYGSTSAANGYGSKSAANGDGSTSAANGDGSTSAANGDGSKSAANGYGSIAEAKGQNTLAAVLGHDGKVRVGERGAFALAYYAEENGWRFLCGKVGEGGIKADTWYQIVDGKLCECEDQ
jgi:hypothetical protein